ncbi:MAG: hypothetical protein K6F05_00805 [Succinivibrio sp.]|nr:hypothetical protein [Succinivibrio sp.]
MEVHSALEAIKAILDLTGWTPKKDAEGYLVELENGNLNFYSPDGACLIIREEINLLPENDNECLAVCRELAKLNAGIARTNDCRIVLKGKSILLEEILVPSSFAEIQIDEVFEDFLNCFDFIKPKVDNNVEMQSTEGFNALQFML